MTAGSKRMSSSSVLPLPLFVIIVSLLLLSLIVSSHALKCKCTQSSPKVPCIDGVCEVPSASSSCLMLDHPNSGLHYACSSNANLSEGECVEKKSKSGANVKVCSCFSSDFCNFKIWPGGQEAVFEEEEESASREEEEGNVDERRTANSAAYWPPPRLCAALLGLQMLIAIVVVPLA